MGSLFHSRHQLFQYLKIDSYVDLALSLHRHLYHLVVTLTSSKDDAKGTIELVSSDETAEQPGLPALLQSSCLQRLLALALTPLSWDAVVWPPVGSEILSPWVVTLAS